MMELTSYMDVRVLWGSMPLTLTHIVNGTLTNPRHSMIHITMRQSNAVTGKDVSFLKIPTERQVAETTRLMGWTLPQGRSACRQQTAIRGCGSNDATSDGNYTPPVDLKYAFLPTGIAVRWGLLSLLLTPKIIS